MKNCYFFFSLLFAAWMFNFSPAKAQQTFHKSYGNAASTTIPNGIIKTSDGGYLIFSDYYKAATGQAGLLIKTTATGDTLWTKFLSNSISTFNTMITSVIELPNGLGYMVAGYYVNPSMPTASSGSVLFRLDTGGNQVWVKVFNYGSGLYWFKSCCLSYDGNILISGISGTMFTPFTNVLMKISPAGYIVWTNNISGFEQQDATSQAIVELNDHSIILLCDTIAPPSSINACVMKLDTMGTVLWAKNYGWSNEVCIPLSITIGTNNSMLVSGQRFNANNMSIGFIMSLDSSGNMLWCREYGNLSSGQASVKRAYELGNGNIAAITGVGDTVVLFITDPSGIVQWTKGFYPGNGTGTFLSNDFVVTSDGGYGIIASDVDKGHFIKTDALGNNDCDTLAVPLISNASAINSFSTVSQVTPITVQVLVPVFFDNKGLDVNDACLTNGVGDVNAGMELSVFPNPFTDAINITVGDNEIREIMLYDLSSKKLMQKEFVATVSLSTANLAKGMYVYEVRTKNGISSKGKLVKE